MTDDEIKDTHQIMKEQGAQDSNIRKATAASCTWSIDKPRRWVRWEETDGSRSIRKLEERKGQADLGRGREIRVLGKRQRRSFLFLSSHFRLKYQKTCGYRMVT